MQAMAVMATLPDTSRVFSEDTCPGIRYFLGACCLIPNLGCDKGDKPYTARG